MNDLFSFTVQFLMALSRATGLTYNEINIIAYYMVAPFVYAALADRILGRHMLKIGFVLGWVIVLCFVGNFEDFSDRLFARSVEFLRLFSAVGLDYIAASVVICLVLPGLVFVVLLSLAVFPSLPPWKARRAGEIPR